MKDIKLKASIGCLTMERERLQRLNEATKVRIKQYIKIVKAEEKAFKIRENEIKEIENTTYFLGLKEEEEAK